MKVEKSNKGFKIKMNHSEYQMFCGWLIAMVNEERHKIRYKEDPFKYMSGILIQQLYLKQVSSEKCPLREAYVKSDKNTVSLSHLEAVVCYAIVANQQYINAVQFDIYMELGKHIL